MKYFVKGKALRKILHTSSSSNEGMHESMGMRYSAACPARANSNADKNFHILVRPQSRTFDFSYGIRNIPGWVKKALPGSEDRMKQESPVNKYQKAAA